MIEKGTYWSDLRRRNGYEKPHKVKYWALGNEMDGQWQMGHKNAEDYGKFALETAKLMKWIDRDIKLVVAGSSDYNGNWIDWNRTVLEYLKNHADYIALHNYVENRSNDYYKFMATTRFAEKAIRITEGLIAEAMTKAERKDPIYIAFDEYNVWYRAKGEEGNEEVYNLEDALVVSTFLNIFVRNAPCGQDGQHGAAGQRHRPDLLHQGRFVVPDDLLPVAALRHALPRHVARHLRRL